MKICIKILQFLLGAWYVLGGLYMSSNYPDLLNTWALQAVPSFVWVLLGATEVVLGATLIISLGVKLKKIAIGSALTMALISLLSIFIYSSYEGFVGALWGIVPAALLIFVAYKRCQP